MAALLAASVGSVVLRPTATTISAGLSLSADQSAVGVVVGGQAVVAVTVSQPGSWVGPVNLTVTGAPSGATVGFLPNPVIPGVPSVVSVLTSASTPVGSYLLRITATNGTSSSTVVVTLNVTLATGFSMVLSPASRVVVDGESTTYDLSINRGLLSGPINLSLSGVPANATATVTPGLSILGSSAKVKISTATNVVPGTYLITVKGTALLASATASAYLVVQPQTYPNFTITGSTSTVLTPGGPSGPINVAISNPFDATMSVTSLGVTVTSTNRSGCGPENYEVTAFSGTYPLTVPGHSTTTLQQLGVTPARWPQVRMLNLPTNQDACKGATVTLTFSGSGNGA